jgi:uncharacterized membrane protein
MTTSADRSPERLVFFSDAVIAIALTLLILPLVDAVQEAAADHAHSFEVISGNQWKIYSFLLSFAVISRMWVSHHRLFEQVKAYNHALMAANIWWLLTVVVLPFPTEMIGGFDEDRFTATFYIGTILAANLCLLAMILIVRADPALLRTDAGALDRQRFAIALNAGLLALGLALAALVPRVGYSALLLLLVVAPAVRIRDRRTADIPA